jgi:transposase
MTEKTSSQKRRKYDSDFKTEVLKMVAHGKPVAEISQALGIGENLIYRWKSKQRQASSTETKGKKESIDVWQEVENLRRKLQQSEMEREILKKALALQAGPFSAARVKASL